MGFSELPYGTLTGECAQPYTRLACLSRCLCVYTGDTGRAGEVGLRAGGSREPGDHTRHSYATPPALGGRRTGSIVNFQGGSGDCADGLPARERIGGRWANSVCCLPPARRAGLGSAGTDCRRRVRGECPSGALAPAGISCPHSAVTAQGPHPPRHCLASVRESVGGALRGMGNVNCCGTGSPPSPPSWPTTLPCPGAAAAR